MVDADHRIKTIICYQAWGCEPSAQVLRYKESDYFYVCGSRIILRSNVLQKTTLLPTLPNIKSIKLISLCPQNKFLASISCLYDDHCILIYDLEKLSTRNTLPKLIKYDDIISSKSNSNSTLNDSMKSLVEFTKVVFSSDSNLLLICTNTPTVGLLIYDLIHKELVKSIPYNDTQIYSISFSPVDNNKVCLTGSNDTFLFYRYNKKSIHSSPISDLTNDTSTSYTDHVWIYDSMVIAGTSNDSLLLLQGSVQINSVQNIYSNCPSVGTTKNNTSRSGESVYHRGVDKLLVRENIVLAISYKLPCMIVSYEVKRYMSSTKQGITAKLLPLQIYQLELNRITQIYSIDWFLTTYENNSNSDELMISTSHNIITYNLKQKTENKSSDNINHISIHNNLLNFHSKAVDHVALSKRNCTICTSSQIDQSLHIRDYSLYNDINFTNFSHYIEEFSENIPQITPLSMSLHPAGSHIAIGTKDQVIEFSILNDSIKISRRIYTTLPFEISNKNVHINNLPVSILQYSNGGQYLAVVTGKIIRVYHNYQFDYSNSDLTAVPCLLLAIVDISSLIHSIRFNISDSYVFIICSDGFIYSYPIMKNSIRYSEYMLRGYLATQISTNTCHTINYSEENIIVSFYHNNNYSDNKSTANAINVNGTPKKDVKLGFLSSSLKSTYNAATSSNTAITRNLTNTATSNVTTNLTNNITTNQITTNPNQYIGIFTNNINQEPLLIPIYNSNKITALSQGWIGESSINRIEIVVIGYEDGKILISTLPFPMRNVITSNTNILKNISLDMTIDNNTALTRGNNINIKSNSLMHEINENKCKIMQLHRNDVTSIIISASGFWVYTTGLDGSVYMLSIGDNTITTSSNSNVTNHTAGTLVNVPEVLSLPDNSNILVDKSIYLQQLNQLSNISNNIKKLSIENNHKLQLLQDEKNIQINQLQYDKKKEVEQRDKIIFNLKDQIKDLKKKHAEEISNLREEYDTKIQNSETLYEKKLLTEKTNTSLLKQSYDEYVMNIKLDVQDNEKKQENKFKQLNEELIDLNKSIIEKKDSMVGYIEYVNRRFQEVLSKSEEEQDNERNSLRTKIKSLENTIEENILKSNHDILQLNIQIQRLNREIEEKDQIELKLTADLDWSRNRIESLETNLSNCILDIKNKNEKINQNEMKIGELTQQIKDIEKVRKALLSQLHSIREEYKPQEVLLLQTTEKLKELEREYEMSLQGLAEKETLIAKQSESLHLLQKQVRELRKQSGNKDGILKRIAKIFKDYQMLLKESKILSSGQPINHSVVIDQNNQMNESSGDYIIETDQRKMIAEDINTSLRRLDDLLKRYMIDEDVDVNALDEAAKLLSEQERHMHYLHRSVNGLKTNLRHVQIVSETKSSSQLLDNQLLLKEVNELRQQILVLTRDNQRLLATVEFTERRNYKRLEREKLTRQYNSKSNTHIEINSNEKSSRKDSYTDIISTYSNNKNNKDIDLQILPKFINKVKQVGIDIDIPPVHATSASQSYFTDSLTESKGLSPRITTYNRKSDKIDKRFKL